MYYFLGRAERGAEGKKKKNDTLKLTFPSIMKMYCICGLIVVFPFNSGKRCFSLYSNTPDCEGWRDAGFCTQHSSMIYHCKKTCGFCTSSKCQNILNNSSW